MEAGMRYTFWFRLLLLLAVASPSLLPAQTDVRSQIDMDRRYLRFDDDKTLEKSREFIRRDSTFYIGYMYQGAYLFYRANDELGFRQAIAPLQKAMDLIEKDYDKQLRTRTSDIYTFMRVSTYQNDYCSIVYWLEQSCQNIEQPDLAMDVLKRLRDHNLQYESGIETYNTMAWIYHRNRMYTSEKFPFLKNSVKENDSMAHMYLDSAIIKVQNDIPVNIGIYDATYLNRLALFTYHYKAILFDYELQIDSANYYYDILLRTGYYSSNNYAEFQYALGDFRNADNFFQEAETRDGDGDKRTREYYYMRGHLNIYRGKPDEADSLLHRVIERQGSTPGFGWHSIGLARALQYEGLNAESQKRINKAANFHELHISTTWGPEQYKLCVATLNYTNKIRFEQEFKFENDEWYFWLNPLNWYKSARYSLQIHHYKMIIAAMVAANPERAQVIYPLFTSENLINFDEVWNVIDGFGNDYFIRIYKQLLEKDQRPHLKKYFRYMIGRLYLADGNKSKAISYFQQVLDDPETSDDYEKLLLARTCEGMALASSGNERDYWTQKMYETYPQLVPFTDLKMKFRLADTGGAGSGAMNSGSVISWLISIVGLLIALTLYILNRLHRSKVHPVIAALLFVIAVCSSLAFYYFGGGKPDPASPAGILSGMRNCSLDFSGSGDEPSVSLEFHKDKDAMEIGYTVMHLGSVVQDGTLRVQDDQMEDAGKMLAYRLFGIKKKTIGEEPEPEPEKKEEKTKK